MKDKPTEAEREFISVVMKFMEIRAWVFNTEINPWNHRRALLTALAVDTRAALSMGVDEVDLAGFDDAVLREAMASMAAARRSRPFKGGDELRKG